MNQTQTRSPRKRLLSLILAVILMIGLLPISAFATSASAQAGEDKAATQDSEFLRIFHLDCGRKYFTVGQIKDLIDTASANNYTHVELAVGNNGLRFPEKHRKCSTAQIQLKILRFVGFGYIA